SVTLVCSQCRKPIAKVRATYQDLHPIFCPRCLGKHKEVPFHVRLRLLRVSRGWTLREAAQQCGIGASALYYYEHRSDALPPLQNRARLNSVFGPALRLSSTAVARSFGPN